MTRIHDIFEAWRSSREHMAKAAGGKPVRRKPRMKPALEIVEGRVLLAGGLLSELQPRGLANFGHMLGRASRQAAVITDIQGSAVVGGPITLSARLVRPDGSPVAGQLLSFRIGPVLVGRAITDATGTATIENVQLRGPQRNLTRVPHQFATRVSTALQPRSAFAASVGRGVLTVSQTSSSLAITSATGTRDGSASVTAVLDSPEGAVAGRQVQFLLDGKSVGSALTRADGSATLSDISLIGLGAGPFTVQARFAGDLGYAGSSASGALSLGKTAATISLANLNRVYGDTSPVAIATSPANLPVMVTYTDASGTVVTDPTRVGVYHVAASIADPNYEGTAVGTLVITPAAVSVVNLAAFNKVYDGTTTATIDASASTLSGILPGDSVTLDASAASAAFDDAHVGVGKTVTVSGLTLTGPDAGNYVLVSSPATTTADVTPRALQVAGVTADNKVYDGTTAATIHTAGATLVGAVPGDSVALDSAAASGAFASRNAGPGAVLVSDLSLTGLNAGDYTLAPTTVLASIAPKVVTVSGVTALDKVYDGTTTATLDTSAAVLAGVIVGDQVAIDSSASVGSFADKNVGAGKLVAINGLVLVGADAGNYEAQGSAASTASITPANLTVSHLVDDKVYDGTTAATFNSSPVLAGLIAGDDVAVDVSGATAAFADKNVGADKTVTIGGSVALGGADSGNYNLVFLPSPPVASITPATLTVTGVVAADKVYDGTTAATIDTSAAMVSGVIGADVVTLDAGTASGTFADKNVGAGKTVTVTGLTLTGADAGNYVAAPTTATADITAAALTASGVVANDRAYDGTTVATLDVGAAVLAGLVAGDDVTLDAASTGTFADANAGVGVTVTLDGLVLAGADAGNYVVDQTSTTTADITARALYLSHIINDKVYDGTTAATFNANPDLDGLIAGDTVTVDPSGTTADFADIHVGQNKAVTVNGPILLGGPDAANYVLIYSPSPPVASITPATLTVTGVVAADKVYDGTTTATVDASAATIGGLIGADIVGVDASAVVGTFDNKNVGADKTVTVTGLTLTGPNAGDYEIGTTTATGDITAATLTASGVVANDKVYDGTTIATLDVGAAVLAGLVAGDDVTLDAASTGTFADANAGVGVTATLDGLVLAGADAGNYVVDQTSTTTADITKAELTVGGLTASKVYDGTTTATIDASAATITGAVGSEVAVLDLSGATAAFADKNAGTGKTLTVAGVAVTGVDMNNYDLALAEFVGDIEQKALDVTGLVATDRTYDGTTDVAVGAAVAALDGAGIVGSDDVTLDAASLVGAVGTMADKHAGAGKTVTVAGLLLTGADAANYKIAATTTVDIAKATVTLVGVTAADKVYDGTTAATIDTTGSSLTGAVGGDSVSVDATAATGAFADKNAGIGKSVMISGTVLTGADAADYDLVVAPVTADITKATITVTGITATKVYDGTTNAALDATAAAMAGVVAGDDVALDATAAVGTFDDKNVGTGKTLGVTGVALTGADAGNYNVVASGLGDIEAKVLHVTGVVATNRAYDGTTAVAVDASAAALNAPDVVAGDDVTLDAASLAGALGTMADKHAGAGKDVAVSGIGLLGVDAANYTIEVATTVDISQATITVTGITAMDKVFDGTTAATIDTSGASIAGVIGADDVSVDTTAAVGTFANAGPAPGIEVIISGLTLSGADAGDYLIAPVSTTANILP